MLTQPPPPPSHSPQPIPVPKQPAWASSRQPPPLGDLPLQSQHSYPWGWFAASKAPSVCPCGAGLWREMCRAALMKPGKEEWLCLQMSCQNPALHFLAPRTLSFSFLFCKMGPLPHSGRQETPTHTQPGSRQAQREAPGARTFLSQALADTHVPRDSLERDRPFQQLCLSFSESLPRADRDGAWGLLLPSQPTCRLSSPERHSAPLLPLPLPDLAIACCSSSSLLTCAQWLGRPDPGGGPWRRASLRAGRPPPKETPPTHLLGAFLQNSALSPQQTLTSTSCWPHLPRGGCRADSDRDPSCWSTQSDKGDRSGLR